MNPGCYQLWLMAARWRKSLKKCVRSLNRHHGLLSVLVSLLLFWQGYNVYRYTREVTSEPKFLIQGPVIRCDLDLPFTEHTILISKHTPPSYPEKTCAIRIRNEGAPATDVIVDIMLTEESPIVMKRVAVYDANAYFLYALSSLMWQWSMPREQSEPRNLRLKLAQLLKGETVLIRLDIVKQREDRRCTQVLVRVRSPEVKAIGRAVVARDNLCWQ